jgi:hypothetical protein
MPRLRLYDLRLGRLPAAIGNCAADLPAVRAAVNTAQRRLLFCKEAQDEGWWGSWAEIAFNVSRTTPYITLPREVARLEQADLCNRPIPINNQFFEYLRFGNGRMPKCSAHLRNTCLSQIYSRNNAVTFTDLTNPPQLLAIHFSDPADEGKRVFLQGLDNNNNVVYSQDGLFEVQGVYVTLVSPFAISPNQFNTITGIQKDLTSGPIQLFQVNPTTGAQILIHTMQAGEQVASYRRYFFDPVPFACCPVPTVTGPQPVTVTAICKLELVPVFADPDYTLIQNEEAIIEEAQAARYEGIDTMTAKQMAAVHHSNAVRYLNGQISHYMGLDQPAVLFRPFGSAGLRRQKIGTLL